MKLLAFALLLVPCAAAQSTVKAAPALEERVRERCEAFRASEHVVGMSVAILDDGKLVFEGAFGERDREAQLAAEKATLFRLASISKPVTATIALQLVEQHKLELDVGIAQYVDGLEPALGAVTLRQILSHTSGIRHYQVGRFDNGTRRRTTAQALDLFAKDPLLFAPGEKYSYSTHAFTLAAAAIEKGAGQDFAACVRERIGRRAPALDLEVTDVAKPMRSALYERKGDEARRSEPREDLSWKYGGGGMESTAGDLARFADLVLRAEIVSEATRDALWTRARTSDGKELDYGLGWGVGAAGKLVSHSGSQQGASSSLSIQRETGVVVVVLTNTQGTNAPALGKTLREVLAQD